MVFLIREIFFIPQKAKFTLFSTPIPAISLTLSLENVEKLSRRLNVTFTELIYFIKRLCHQHMPHKDTHA